MPTLIGSDEIGGAFVRIGFFGADGKWLRPRSRLSAKEVLAMGNRRALVNSGRLAIFPPSDIEGEPADAAKAVERHVVSKGFGKFSVIEGRVLNDEPMTKEEAEALAAS